MRRAASMLPDKYLAREIDTRPTYGLDEQIKLLSGAKNGSATVDKWFKGLGDYLVSTGTLKEPPKLTDFITERIHGASGRQSEAQGLRRRQVGWQRHRNANGRRV